MAHPLEAVVVAASGPAEEGSGKDTKGQVCCVYRAREMDGKEHAHGGVGHGNRHMGTAGTRRGLGTNIRTYVKDPMRDGQ
jgi:hypothetical protein